MGAPVMSPEAEAAIEKTIAELRAGLEAERELRRRAEAEKKDLELLLKRISILVRHHA
jgi:hypothetical protein